MASVCRFWRISPIEYRQLTLAELRALCEWQEDEIAEQKRQQARQRRRSR